MIPLFLPDVNANDSRAAARVIRSGWVGPGKLVAEFEAELSRWMESPWCVCMSSGTAALMAALMWHEQQGRKKMLVAPAYGHPAAVNAAVVLGYEVILCDVDPSTGVMDSGRLRHIMSDPKAVDGGVLVVVEHNGLTIETGGMATVPSRRGGSWTVVQDSCQSMHNKPTLHGDFMAVSFSPQKVVTTGQGGALFCRTEAMAAGVQRITAQGERRGGTFPRQAHALGVNLRMSDVAAAFGLSQLSRIERTVKRWRQIRSWYDERRPWVWCPSVRTPVPDHLMTEIRRVAIAESARLYPPVIANAAIRHKVSSSRGWPGALEASMSTVYLPGHHKVSWQLVQKIRRAIDGER